MKGFAVDKKGMTLIEVIVGLLICGIFVTAAIAALSPVLSTYRATENKSEAQMISKNLMETMRGKTNTCSKLTTENNVIEYDGKKIKISDEGYLLVDGNMAYDKSYYNDKTVGMKTGQISENKINVVLSVYSSKGKTLAEADGDLEPITQTGEKTVSEGEGTYPGTDIKLTSNYWPEQSDYADKYMTIDVASGGIFKYTDGEYYVVVEDISINKKQASTGPGGEVYGWYSTMKITGRIIKDWSDGSQKSDLARGDMVLSGGNYYVFIDGGRWGYAPPSRQWYRLP
ncbi:MAG: prepilin-type N-terminal cleavage/methylation domain-containing protein [Eubacteriaceae bacterium]|nr:prepilin-type N-terminal cleavage/methylation domain-containing protein [Eubacteriaceae bacterium]